MRNTYHVLPLMFLGGCLYVQGGNGDVDERCGCAYQRSQAKKSVRTPSTVHGLCRVP